MLAATRDWRLRMGSLSYTNTLLTRPGEQSRLKVLIGTGLQTPTGIITEGSHDSSTARYTFEPDNDGDETVTAVSALDDLHPAPNHIKSLAGVTHGRLMTDPHALDYFYLELSREPMAIPDARSAANQTL